MPSFTSTGGIFSRLDANGNLTFYDTAGNVMAIFIGSLFAAKLNAAVAQLLANITTTSTTAVSTGFGLSITPRVNLPFSGFSRVMIISFALLSSTIGGDQIRLSLYRNTSGVPSLGAGVGTDTLLASNDLNIGANNAFAQLSLNPFDDTVSKGVTSWFYLAWFRLFGTGTLTMYGAANVKQTVMTLLEI